MAARSARLPASCRLGVGIHPPRLAMVRPSGASRWMTALSALLPDFGAQQWARAFDDEGRHAAHQPVPAMEQELRVMCFILQRAAASRASRAMLGVSSAGSTLGAAIAGIHHVERQTDRAARAGTPRFGSTSRGHRNSCRRRWHCAVPRGAFAANTVRSFALRTHPPAGC